MNLHPLVPMRSKVFLFEDIATAGKAILGDDVLSKSRVCMHQIDLLASSTPRGDLGHQQIAKTLKKGPGAGGVGGGEELANGGASHFGEVMGVGPKVHFFIPKPPRCPPKLT